VQVKVSDICARLNVDGLRGDMVSCRAAKALAAFEQRTEVTIEDVEKIISLSLSHRLRKDPLQTMDSGSYDILNTRNN